MITVATKAERFEMRLDAELLRKLDDWRTKEADLPSRAEAIRRLIVRGTDQNGLEISNSDRLIIMMLCDIAGKLNVDGEVKTDLVKEAIYGGHFWGIEWDMDHLFHSHSDSKDELNHVVDVLDMWNFLEAAYEQMSEGEKLRIKTDLDSFAGEVRFPGFDGNYESNLLSISRFLINKMGRFSRFKGRELNSHMKTSASYRRMTSIFSGIRPSLVGREMNFDEVISVMKVRYRD